jgi:molybdopterin-containing oxidoreductase family membrane subunit
MTTTTSAKPLTPAQPLPYGVARFNVGWYVTIVVLLGLVGLGVFAYLAQLIEGEIVTGMRDIGTMAGAPWGIYIAFVVYFIGVSFAGITVAVLIRLLGMDHLRPIARMAEVLTVIALILGGLCIIADVGQPGRAIINLFKYARPQSPFFGTFTLVVSGYMFASLVYLYLDSRADAARMAQIPSKLQGFYRIWAAGWKGTPAEQERRRISSFWLAIAILPLLVVAHSTLGFVFGLQVGRPGWFGGLQAPGFVILAGVSGLGMLIIIAAILRKVLKLEEQFTIGVFKFLGNFLMALTVAYLYFLVVEMLTAVYVAGPHETAINQALLFGQYAVIFWTSVALLVISFVLLFVQFARNSYSFGLTLLVGVLVNLAAIGKRYLIVIPSQTHGMLLPYTTGTYSPTWVEISIIVGLFALGTLLFILFMKLFPIMKVPETVEGGQS